MNRFVKVYTDGGVIGRNPSPVGGTWAFVWVGEDGSITQERYGVLTPQELGLPEVSNNHTELYAQILALESRPEGWSGELWSDSKITLQRVFEYANLKNVPPWMVQRLKALQRGRQLDPISYHLCRGHPSKKALREATEVRGLPISGYNVRADELCNLAGKEYALNRVNRAIQSTLGGA